MVQAGVGRLRQVSVNDRRFGATLAPEMTRKLLVLNVATLHPAAVRAHTSHLRGLAESGSLRDLQTAFPSLSCSSHATMLTGQPPSAHGIVGNGWYDRDYAKIFMWQRSSHMVGGETLWEAARKRQPGLRCANLFWRYCADSSCDTIVTERPAYWASGRKTFDFHTTPAGLHDELKARFGNLPFQRFWGPMAGVGSTQWILNVAHHIMSQQAPELLLVYAPFLDYDAERFGPQSPQWIQALQRMDREVVFLLEAARAEGRDIAIVSDYGWCAVQRPILINRALRQAGLLEVERLPNGERLEAGSSRAFAVVDNQVAHVYVANREDLASVRTLLEDLDGVDQVLDRDGQAALGIDHARSGDLVAISDASSWFAYPYWLEPEAAPDFEHCIAIFDKIGWDPTEILLRPGLGGYLRMGLRVLQKQMRLAVPYDVCSGDPYRIRASRNARSADAGDQGAALITSWPLEHEGAVSMAALKDIFLQRMFSQ